MVKVREDMTGWVMSEHGVPDSRLTVIKQVEDKVRSNGVHEAQWLCKCNCNNEIVISGYLIRNGSVRSCGCLRKESEFQNGKNSHKTNSYDLSGEYGIGWTLNTNKEFYFDLEDYDKIKDYCWFEKINKSSNYIRLQAWDPLQKKSITMSKMLGFTYYDHKNRNTLDNRKENFRQASSLENARNRSVPNNNTSGVIGVSWHKGKGKWQTRIMVDYKSIYIGAFLNKEDAIKARLRAEAKYYGNFAPQQYLFEKYDINMNKEIN